ncbi:LEAF RUST 10 DISEASE-RESISTANCE LOCUS RECEPTOR-LIKE PROTEIN KINASE-like 1.2 [Telopea speciosissima]|uniref:LEAF RUST 10 DISEASE-RESISTANCE LOCUS RECEPTOR-LIKE PROTEIN KINASE-like 1.2 n=1 Tax=Telopea speciosissima TaxID=54955 RepID=UPI001CC7F8A7|nr:LEAF RUST 10 DISEASE-RESISTANCE LOCUS RECEPTOR-LIKE PROTEIN KINASE-like 1.2 [Telopea speciosissima]
MDEQIQFMSYKQSSSTRSMGISIPAFSLIFLLLLSVQTALCADWRYEACSKDVSCGEGPNIGYPFWIDGKQDFICGIPGFQLTCKKRQPTINFFTADYVIRNISYQNQTLRVIDAKVQTDGGCSSQIQNLTLDSTRFRYGPNHADLFLFLNCNQSLPSEYSLHGINCSSVSSMALLEDDPVLDKAKALGYCNRTVVAPVDRNSTNGANSGVSDVYGNSSYYTQLLKEGFDLIWSASDCSKCQRSGGQCGFNWTTYNFICLCHDRPHLVRCGKCMFISVLCSPLKISFILLLISKQEWVTVDQNSCPKPNLLDCPLFCILVHNPVYARRWVIPVLLPMALMGYTCFGSLGGGIIIGCLMFFIYNRHHYRKGGLLNLVRSKNLSSPSLTPLSGIPFDPTSTDLENGSNYFEFGVHVFTYNELEEATNNFNSNKELGDGGFGTVYHGKLRDGREVAVKRLYENNFKRVEQFMNEVQILTRLRHQSLVTLYGCTSRHCRELLLVYEFIPNGTVADHLHGDKTDTRSLTWPIRMSIAIETATALSYLHASDIIHRDVKTNNILLDNNFRVKVADFGLSRLFPTNVTHVSTAPQGTPGYVDPEYHQCYQLTDKSDVYSFGVVLIELISSMPAVDINRHRHEINLSNLAINKIQNKALPELVDPCLGFDSDYIVQRMITSVAELAFRCLQLEKEMRPTMDEVLENLKQIENEDYNMEKAEGVNQTDSIGLLKTTIPPFSPDSVTNKWVSQSTTPNTSS